MRIDRFDHRRDGLERQRAVGGVRDGLRLDRAEHGRAAAFELVGMCFHADEVFVAALAVRHQRQQVRLRAARNEQTGLEAEVAGQPRLQGVHGRVVAEHVVADVGPQAGLPHRRGRAGDGVAAKIDDVHGRSRRRGSGAF